MDNQPPEIPKDAEIEYDPATAIQYKQVAVPLTTGNHLNS